MVTAADFAAFEKKAEAEKSKPKKITLSGKDMIVQPYVCGFCCVGNHYNSKNKSRSGAALPACKMKYFISYPYSTEVECFCECTSTERAFRELVIASGRSAPEYLESLPTSVLSTSLIVGSDSVDTGAASDPEADRRITRDDGMMQFDVGRGGRVARGQLEQAVWQICVDALDGKIAVPNGKITPALIAFEINLRSRLSYPAGTGAITAVLMRWSTTMLCEVETGPIHLVSMKDSFKEAGPS